MLIDHDCFNLCLLHWSILFKSRVGLASSSLINERQISFTAKLFHERPRLHCHSRVFQFACNPVVHIEVPAARLPLVCVPSPMNAQTEQINHFIVSSWGCHIRHLPKWDMPYTRFHLHLRKQIHLLVGSLQQSHFLVSGSCHSLLSIGRIYAL